MYMRLDDYLNSSGTLMKSYTIDVRKLPDNGHFLKYFKK